MAADLNNLKNIQPLEINTTILTNTTPSELVTNIFSITTQQVGDLWFYIGIVCIFLFTNWLFYRREEGFGYDISRSTLLSSGFCFFISVAVLLSSWISSVFPVVWFGSLVFISWFGVYVLKQKGL